MQNAVIGMILGASLVGLTLVGLRLGRDGWRGAVLKLALGALIGGVAAAVAVAIRADLVPDTIEVTISRPPRPRGRRFRGVPHHSSSRRMSRGEIRPRGVSQRWCVGIAADRPARHHVPAAR